MSHVGRARWKSERLQTTAGSSVIAMLHQHSCLPVVHQQTANHSLTYLACRREASAHFCIFASAVSFEWRGHLFRGDLVAVAGISQSLSWIGFSPGGSPLHKRNAADFLPAGRYYRCSITFCQETFWGSLLLRAHISLPFSQFANWHMMTYIQNKSWIHTSVGILFCFWLTCWVSRPLRKGFLHVRPPDCFVQKTKVCHRIPF